MIRKYHNHSLQTNQWHHEENTQNTNSHKTPGRQVKQQALIPIKMIVKIEGHRVPKTKHRTPQTMGATINILINKSEPLPENRQQCKVKISIWSILVRDMA